MLARMRRVLLCFQIFNGSPPRILECGILSGPTIAFLCVWNLKRLCIYSVDQAHGRTLVISKEDTEFTLAVGRPSMFKLKYPSGGQADIVSVSSPQSKGINHDVTRVYQLTYCCFETRGREDFCLKSCHRFSNQSGVKSCHTPL